MKKKNILFICDLRDANNYGAIATTESLVKMVESIVPEQNIRYIKGKSLQRETPESGWKNNGKKSLKSKIGKIFPIILKLKKRGKEKKLKYPHVAYKWEVFQDYASEVMLGKRLKYEKTMLEWSDIVFINGEGNIVHGTDSNGIYRTGGLYILFLAYLAKQYFNKQVFVVNHTVDPGNRDVFKIIKNVYPTLDKIYLREKLSLNLLASKGIKGNFHFVPDALFSYNPECKDWIPSYKLRTMIDFTKPYICLGDSSGMKSKYSTVKWNVYLTYRRLIDGLKNIIPQIVFVDGFNGSNQDINKVIRDTNIGYVNFSNCSYEELYQVLAKSEIFISGRWHNSILSILSGTPILLMGADSHKTEALYDLIEYPFNFFNIHSIPIHIEEIVFETKKILMNKDKIRELIISKIVSLKKESYKNIDVLYD